MIIKSYENEEEKCAVSGMHLQHNLCMGILPAADSVDVQGNDLHSDGNMATED